MKHPQTWTAVDGFKKWDPYFDFAKDKYSDVSVALVQKDFEMAKRTMRELIDNTSPYHNREIKVKDEQDKEVAIDYANYFELCVDDYQEALEKETARHQTPQDKDLILKQKDNFYKQIRFIRRLIMQDLSRAEIIPSTTEKKKKDLSKAISEMQ